MEEEREIMNREGTLRGLIWRNGDWIEKAVFALKTLPFKELILHFGSLQELNDFMIEYKKEMEQEIIKELVNCHQWKYKETGERVALGLFLEYEIMKEITLRQLSNALVKGKYDIMEVKRIHEVICSDERCFYY